MVVFVDVDGNGNDEASLVDVRCLLHNAFVGLGRIHLLLGYAFAALCVRR